VLITGASGLLGLELCYVLKKFNFKVIAQTNKNNISKDLCSTNICSKLESLAEIQEIFNNYRPSWVVHCAAYTDLDFCELNPLKAHELHVESSRKLAVCAANSKARIIYISTDSVYDSDTPALNTELSATKPVNVYARTKLEGERICQHHHNDSIIARVNFFSYNKLYCRGLMYNIINNINNNKIFNGFIDVHFNPLSVSDLASILYLIILRNIMSGIYNISASNSCSKYDFAKMIARYSNLNEQLVHESYIGDSLLYTKRPKNTAMNSNLLATILNIEMPNIENSIYSYSKSL